jgi:hypothetical protein
MPEETVPTQPITLDQGRLDALYQNLQKSYRNAAEDAERTTDKGSEINEQLFAFYERLLLLNTGMIGISVSAILSYGSHPGLLGHTKYVVIVFVALAWLFLLLSIVLCRSVMMAMLLANQLLYKQWGAYSLDFNGAVISGDVARLSTAIKGSIDVDGQMVDAGTLFNQIAQTVKAQFEKSKEIFATDSSHIDAVKSTYGEGKRAVAYTQIALLLLGAAALALLFKM